MTARAPGVSHIQRGIRSGRVQRESVNLNVDSAQHPDAVDVEPENEEHQVGFTMDVTLTPETQSQYATVDQRYDLRQYVKDSHWMAFTNGGYDAATNVEEEDWALDSFGFDDALGEWSSDNQRTVFNDEPGYLGDRAIPADHLLGHYSVKFYWTVNEVGEKDTQESDEIELEADPDDKGNVTYKPQKLNGNFDF